jgi:hypothetical protein
VRGGTRCGSAGSVSGTRWPRSWKAYLQSLPYAGYQGICNPAKCNGTPDSDPLYVSKHDTIQNYTTSWNSADWSRQVPIGQLGADLHSGDVPRFSYVIPDECHDMHGDPPYCLDSDEGSSKAGRCDASPGGGQVVTIVITSHGPRGITDAAPANHYSTLSTIQHTFGLGGTAPPRPARPDRSPLHGSGPGPGPGPVQGPVQVHDHGS